MNNALAPIWRSFQAVAERVSMGANAIGTLCVLALVVIVNYDVVARGVFNNPFMGAVEVVQFSLVFIVFLQLPDVVRVGRLTRSDGFLILMGKRMPVLALWLQRFIDTLAAIFMSLVAYALWPEFIKMWKTQDFFGVPGVFTAPYWPIKLIICLSAALCVLLFVGKVIGKAPVDHAELNSLDELDNA